VCEIFDGGADGGQGAPGQDTVLGRIARQARDHGAVLEENYLPVCMGHLPARLTVLL